MTALTANDLSNAEGGLAQDPSPYVTHSKTGQALDIQVRGATCGGCLSRIEGALGALPGVSTARLNLSTGRLRVEWAGSMPARRIVSTITGLGFGAVAFDPQQADVDHLKAERRLLVALAVAGFAAGNVMLLSVSVWAGQDMAPETRQLLHWVSALIAIPAAAFCGRPFFASALASIKARRMNMDVPISLAVMLAVGMSLYETAIGGEHAYFDASVTLLFFLLIGRFLDARLRRRAYAAANALAAMQTGVATRLAPLGAAETVRVSDVRPGDVLLLARGERLCVDGEIVSGASDVDLRLVTGETAPAAAAPGQVLRAGAVNMSAPLQIRATAAASDSLMADIARLLEAGEQKKSAYRRLADKAAAAYVPRVHAMAALGFAGWLIAGAGVPHAIFIAVTVLIITCPCAMALAAPLVQVVAAGRLYAGGVYLASGDALERIAEVDHVVFDKTGTLTMGDPMLSGSDDPAQLQLAAQLARASRHPWSRAIARAAGSGPVADDICEHPGEGVSGRIGGEEARLGSAAFVGGEASDAARLWFRIGSRPPVAFRFEDHMRPDAAAAIDELRRMGLTVEIISGDALDNVRDAAARLGIEAWTAQATPASKAERLRTLEAAGRKVLMVGDGVNDAAAIAGAHASLAPGAAVDVSRLAADCVYANGDLAAVPRIVGVARKARARMRENFGFAVVYNLLAVPIALAGWATPLVAALAMSGSSAVVTLNALRLAKGKEAA